MGVEDMVTQQDQIPVEPQPQGVGSDQDHDKVARLEAELATTRDRYVRLMADMDNMQKRSKREITQEVQRSKDKLIRDWLAVVDGAERALSAATDDDESPWLEGTRGLHRLMLDILARHGVKPFGVRGEAFDPHLHEAIGMIPDPEVPSQSVAVVQVTGYRYNEGPVIRPAMVVVSQ